MAGISQEPLIGKQLACVAVEDRLDAVAVFNPREAKARSPELVARLAQFLDVIESTRDFVDGPTQIGAAGRPPPCLAIGGEEADGSTRLADQAGAVAADPDLSVRSHEGVEVPTA